MRISLWLVLLNQRRYNPALYARLVSLTADLSLLLFAVWWGNNWLSFPLLERVSFLLTLYYLISMLRHYRRSRVFENANVS